ncbi:hypothetical protein [Photobacterium nomapromontoriensis]|uniref:hypothetical protein n=1 Tax=Photobacterium nomapromontoriensis TaxID=2910237 RepID=UPI003D12991E
MKKMYIILGIPFCLWTIVLALENESVNYILLNVLLAIPIMPTIFTDLLGSFTDVFKGEEKQSLQDAIEADRLASESEMLNRKIYETTIVVQPDDNQNPN